jgi:DNA polymerase-3 subunit epsilon
MGNFCCSTFDNSKLESSRLLFLDTETTGLMSKDGHRIVEIAMIEYVGSNPSGRVLHHYLNPQCDIDLAAQSVHGLTLDFLNDKPKFADVADEIVQFITGAVLVIHNAPFDLSFLDAELQRADRPLINEMPCTVIDSLVLAKAIRPNTRNSLEALCLAYSIDLAQNKNHGALLDAQILAQVFLYIKDQYLLLQQSDID